MSSIDICERVQTELCGVINREYQKLRSTQYKSEIIWKYALVLILAIFLATLLWMFNIPDFYQKIGYGALAIVALFLIYQIITIYIM
jgi:hypothetical protein